MQKTLDNELVSNVAVRSSDPNIDKCEVCSESKTERKSNTPHLIKTNVPGHTIHCDSYTSGINTITGLNTAYIFIDEGSRLLNVQLVKNKSKEETEKAFNRFLAFQKEALGNLPIRFHSGRGKEFDNSVVSRLLESLQIRHSFSCADLKQENGLVERMIKHLIYTVNSILNSSGLPISLWNELFQASAHLVNIRYYKRTLNSLPFVLYYGYSPPIDHRRIIGTYAWVHIPLAHQPTLSKR